MHAIKATICAISISCAYDSFAIRRPPIAADCPPITIINESQQNLQVTGFFQDNDDIIEPITLEVYAKPYEVNLVSYSQPDRRKIHHFGIAKICHQNLNIEIATVDNNTVLFKNQVTSGQTIRIGKCLTCANPPVSIYPGYD